MPWHFLLVLCCKGGLQGPTKTSRTEMQDLTVELGSVACAEESRVLLTATAKVY